MSQYLVYNKKKKKQKNTTKHVKKQKNVIHSEDKDKS